MNSVGWVPGAGDGRGMMWRARAANPRSAALSVASAAVTRTDAPDDDARPTTTPASGSARARPRRRLRTSRRGASGGVKMTRGTRCVPSRGKRGKKNSEVTTKTPRRDATRAPLGSVSRPKSIDRFETDDRRGVVSVDRDRFQIQERFRTDPPADPTTPSRFRGTVSGGRSTPFFRLALGGRGRPPLVSFESSPRSPLPAGARGAPRLLPRARISPRISRPHAPPLGLGRAPPRRARRSDSLARAHPFPFRAQRRPGPRCPRGPADARGRQRRAPARTRASATG